MGNTVGSTSTNFCNFTSNRNDAYILGLWCADKYHWTSSIGISNTNVDLLDKFLQFFRERFPRSRLKLRIYHPTRFRYSVDKRIIQRVGTIREYASEKATMAGYHLYVNSRPLVREFLEAKAGLGSWISPEIIKSYIAGRFDGDGSIAKNLRDDCRIVYTKKYEAELEKYFALFSKITKISTRTP